MGGSCAYTGEMKGVYKIMVGKPEGKRLFIRPRHSWKS